MSTSSTSSTTSGLNSLGGTLQITGLASGLDTDQIITELMAIKQQPVNTLQNQENFLAARDSSLTTIQTALQTVLTDAQSLGDPTLYQPAQTISSSNSTLVAASLQNSTGAATGGYTVSVSQLASSAQRTFAYTAPSSDDAITIDGQSVTISAGESVDDLASDINSNGNLDVYASAVNGNLVLSNRATGDTGANYIQVSDPNGSLVENTAMAQEGQNAAYTVGSNSYSSASNTVTNGIPGVTLTLSAVTSSPVTINVGAAQMSASAITGAIQQFVSDYNSAITAIQTQLSTVPTQTSSASVTATSSISGTLYQDPELSSLLSELRTTMYQTLSGLPSGMSSMLDIGVSTGATTGSGTVSQTALAGDLTVDTTALTSAIQSNPSGVKSMLYAWSSSFSSTLASEAGPGGSISGRLSADSVSSNDLDNQITDMQAALADQQQQLVAQYAQLEETLSENSSQATWLSSQIAALPSI